MAIAYEKLFSIRIVQSLVRLCFRVDDFEAPSVNAVAQYIQRAYRLAEITQKVGFALWQLQELEVITALYFVLVAQARRGMGFTDGNAVVKIAQSKNIRKNHQGIRKSRSSNARDTTAFR